MAKDYGANKYASVEPGVKTPAQEKAEKTAAWRKQVREQQAAETAAQEKAEIGRAACRERV